MLSANQKKFVNSLKQKKFRNQHNCFVVEGFKMVEELLLSNFETETIFALSDWATHHPNLKVEVISENELNSISSLITPNKVIAIVKQKEKIISDLSQSLSIVLDDIQDPGNFGTIIRTADWFGITNIICSENCVDVYNPKVIQATMGSLFRANVFYTNLTTFFSKNQNLTVYGALLNGENVSQKKLKSKGSILLMGNESKGISKNLIPFVTEKITIPKFGKAESLNVATATAILCFECKRLG
ncbi:MAG: RNA methyltransferase [Flavobacteriales bacterium CG_4_9_14_3_um_filter_32_8]|nr:MAG: RNA methyltransferase [Flavobacteriales bacterium CG_4_9_14_3_um_filter_32_8]